MKKSEKYPMYRDKKHPNSYYRQYIKRKVLKKMIVEFNKTTKEIHLLNSDYIKYIKHKNVCPICGETRDVCFVFHHLIPKEKSFSLGYATKKNTNHKDEVSFEEMLEEMKKCTCICVNCHHEIHYHFLLTNDKLKDFYGEDILKNILKNQEGLIY